MIYIRRDRRIFKPKMKFDRLTLVEDTGKKQGTNHIWLCQCECGNFCEVPTGKIGYDICSCGCLKIETHRTHNQSKTRLYNIWTLMKKRCDCSDTEHYEYYGGRGITYCDEWNIYENFRDWALNNGYKNNLTIDRIDVNGNYEPSNCRWVTNKIQQNNKRSNKILKHNGKEMTMSEWADYLKIPYTTLRSRISRCKSESDIDRALDMEYKPWKHIIVQ